MEHGFDGVKWSVCFLHATLLLLTSTTFAAPPTNKAPSDRWTLFRGSVEMTGRTAAELPEQPELLWSINTDDSFDATATIADGVVYLPGVLKGKCFALSLADGTPRWTFTSAEEEPVKSSPCLTDELVIFGNDVGVMRALRRSDGKEVWTYQAEAEFISSPTLLDGKIIAGSYDNNLYCWEAASGKLLWKVVTNGPVHCSPTYVDGKVAVAGCDGFLHFVSIEDGKEEQPLEIGGQIASTPALEGDRLFFGTMGESVVGVDWKKREIVWSYRNSERSFPFYSSPAVIDGLVLIGGRDKAMRALDQKTGEEKWLFRTKARVDSSPVIVGARLFFGSNDGRVYALDTKTGEKRWDYLLGGEVTASPAIADGRLVIASTNGTIFCFGAK